MTCDYAALLTQALFAGWRSACVCVGHAGQRRDFSQRAGGSPASSQARRAASLQAGGRAGFHPIRWCVLCGCCVSLCVCLRHFAHIC